MNETKHTIWSNDTDQFDDDAIREELKENGFHPNDITAEMIGREKNDLTGIRYHEEMLNMDRHLDGRVLCIASLGLWDGRKSGYRMMGDNLNECLCAFQGDFNELYFDGKDICATDTHHDGTNRYTFREIKENTNYEILLKKILNGTATRTDIGRYTRSLSPYACEIYGWKRTRTAA